MSSPDGVHYFIIYNFNSVTFISMCFRIRNLWDCANYVGCLRWILLFTLYISLTSLGAFRWISPETARGRKGRKSKAETEREGEVIGEMKSQRAPSRGSERRCNLPSGIRGRAPTARIRVSTVFSARDGLSWPYVTLLILDNKNLLILLWPTASYAGHRPLCFTAVV